MIYIVTALYAEAHPFIARFQLKKECSHTRFQVFQNEAESLCLIISGTGSVPVAAAVSSICTECGAGAGDFLLNAGICAQAGTADTGAEEAGSETRLCQTGDIFLCSKITEQASGKTFYPDILYRHPFAEAQITTVPKPYDKTAPPYREETGFCLYDMEAAAVYQAGAYYFGPHQMSFLKVISDDGNARSVSPEQIERLIDWNMKDLAGYIAMLQNISLTTQRREILRENTAPKELDRLCHALHCSQTMSESLRQHIRYCILAGIDYASVLHEMYESGKLPCKDKREGKLYFEELKERLL